MWHELLPVGDGDPAGSGEPWTGARRRPDGRRRKQVLLLLAVLAVIIVTMAYLLLEEDGDGGGGGETCFSLAASALVGVSGCAFVDTDLCTCVEAPGAATVSWTDARAGCLADGGDLLRVRSVDTNDAAYSLCAGESCWLGLHRASAGSGDWLWTDGSALAAADAMWIDGGEDEGGECAVIFGSAAASVLRGRWSAAKCGGALVGLCERSVVGQEDVVAEFSSSGSDSDSDSNSGSSSGSGLSACDGYVSQDDCAPIPDDFAVPDLDPCWAEGTEGTVFGFMGDYGLASSYCEAYVAALVEKFESQFGTLAALGNTGDNNYWDGANATIYDNVGQYYARFVEAETFFPTLGNHDWNALPGNLSTIGELPYLSYFPYLRHLDCPEDSLGSYYHVEAVPGVLDLFMLNSNLGTLNSTEYADATEAMRVWTQAAMEASTAAFKVVAFHHPYYSTAIHDPLQADPGGWPFEDWGADLVFMGHEHAFERIIQPDHDDLTYVLQGLGGHPWRYQIHDCAYVQPGSQVRYNSHHAATVGIVSASELTMCTYDVEGAQVDAFTLSSS